VRGNSTWSVELTYIMEDDQSSTTSSLEIVELPSETVHDCHEVINEMNNISPDIDDVTTNSNSARDDNSSVNRPVEDRMTTSQYAQVIFQSIEDSYSPQCDIICQYTLTEGLNQSHGDRVALYKLPYLQPHEYVTFVWVQMSSNTEIREQQVIFEKSSLPKEDDFYQFQYLQGDSNVAGASIPFQIRGELGGTSKFEELERMTTENTTQIADGFFTDPTNQSLQEKVLSMETKYSDLLTVSEKISEELNEKQQSFVVLENQNQMMYQAVDKVKELEQDMASLVGEKLKLEQELEQKTEIFSQTEISLSTTSSKLDEIQNLLKEKDQQIEKLEVKLSKIENKCKETSEQLVTIDTERERLSGMLSEEIEARDVLLQQKDQLVGRLEDTSNMLHAAVKSKNMAVEEIRTQIQQQDILRNELAMAREEAGTAEAELVLVRQELRRCQNTIMERTNQAMEKGKDESKDLDEQIRSDIIEDSHTAKENVGDELISNKNHTDKQCHGSMVEQDSPHQESNSFVVESVLSSLGARLEASEMEVRQKNEELAILHQIEGQKLDIHEKCLEDADKRAMKLEMENKKLLASREELEGKLGRLEVDKIELKKRLEVGAMHYRKLVMEKENLEKKQVNGHMEELQCRVRELERELSELQISQQGRISQASSLNQAWTGLGAAQHTNTSQASSLTQAWTGLGMSDTSGSYMDSIKIQEAVQHSNTAIPIVSQPSKMSTSITSQRSTQDQLPTPLLPENIDPTVGVPELQPRAPAPYSMSNQQEDIIFSRTENVAQERQEQPQKDQEQPRSMEEPPRQECPLCGEMFHVSELEFHVEQHMANTIECPVCSKTFDIKDQGLAEEHVQGHFNEEESVQSLTIRGWDLGID